MGNRCYLIAVLLMILAPLTLASAEPVDRSYGESNSALSPSPFRSSHDTYIPFALRQGLDAHYAHYVRLSVVSESTIADHEGLQLETHLLFVPLQKWIDPPNCALTSSSLIDSLHILCSS
jgi:hypothetical protein